MKNLKLPTVPPGNQWSWDPEVTNVAQSWGQSVTFVGIYIVCRDDFVHETVTIYIA